MNEKLTSKEILEQFVQKSGLLEEQSKNFIDTFQYVLLQAIEHDKIVKISGLGTFQLVWNKPRKSVDVRTQQEIEIAGHYKLTFTPESALKERVNAEFAHLEIKEIEQPQKKESPIEKLSQQAKELKEIIDGIQQDNNKVEVEETVEATAENLPFEQVETIDVSEIQEIIKEEEVVEIGENVEEKTDDALDVLKRVQEMFEEKVVEEQIVEEQIIEEKIIEEKIIEEPIGSTLLSNQEKEEIVEKVEEKTDDALDVLKRVQEMFEEKVVEEQKFEEKIIEEIVEEPKIEEKIVEEQIIEEPKIEEKIVEEQIVSTLLSNQEKEEIVEKVEEKTDDALDVLKRVQEMFEEKVVEEPKIEEEIIVEQIIEEPKIEEEIIEEKTEVASDEQTTEQSTKTEIVIDEKDLAQKQSAIDFFYQKPEPPIEVKANTFDYIEDNRFQPKKRRGWLVWLIILLVLAAAATAFCFLKPDLAKEYWNLTIEKTTKLTQKVSDWFGNTGSVDIDQDTISIDTIPADTIEVDLNTTVQPVEVSQTPKISIFDEPRNYTEFITSVTMSGGNTLVKLAEKHYGHKLFWVYIYEANKNKIADPDRISAGQVIKVPKLNKNLIDAQNPACVEYAQKLHDKYLKR